MNYKIQEINGRLYKVMENGGRLIHKESKYPKCPGVYLVTYMPTGKMYVGSTMDLNCRSIAYRAKLIRGKTIFKGMSAADLKFEVLQKFKDIEEDKLREFELIWILKKNTAKPNGLNTRNPVTLNNLPGVSPMKYKMTGSKRKYYNNPKPFPY